MSRAKDEDEPKGGRPGPTDQGGEGGMATREVEAEQGADGDRESSE
ncbi:hypothetical protein AB0M22_28150 [Nocardia sp. NPDC051756]